MFPVTLHAFSVRVIDVENVPNFEEFKTELINICRNQLEVLQPSENPDLLEQFNRLFLIMLELNSWGRLLELVPLSESLLGSYHRPFCATPKSPGIPLATPFKIP